MSLDAFSNTIHRLYAAASDPGGWAEALRALEDLTGSAGATINFVPKDAADTGFVLAGRFSVDLCMEYARDYMAICPRTAQAFSRPDLEFAYDSLVMSEAEMDRDPVYNWFGSLGLRYYLGTRLPAVGNFHANVSLQRTPRQGHVQADDIALFKRLKPHVAQAVKLADALGSMSANWQFGMALLDAMPQGVFVLDQRGRLLFANRTGDRLLREKDGLVATERSLSAMLSRDAQRLDQLIQGALQLSTGTGHGGGGWLRLPRPSGHLPYSVFVAPIVGEAAMATFGRPSAMIMVHDPESSAKLDPSVLRSLYGLTETEARLASALASGHDAASASHLLGITVGTARVHLKAVFRKMEISRQQDLVRVIGSLALAGVPADG